MTKNWTGERLETDIYSRDTIEHLHRYALAMPYAKGKAVLDIASGEGYGSHLLSSVAQTVCGVDIDPGSIASARGKYVAPNLTFKAGSADAIPMGDASLDLVVSFETLEHHDRHDEMMREIKRVLRPGGMLILSTPDKKHYSDLKSRQNEFHVRELYREEFQDLVSTHFAHSQFLSQYYINGCSVIRQDDKGAGIPVSTGDFAAVQASVIHAFYLLAIASDAAQDTLEDSIFDGSAITGRMLQQEKERIYRSWRYRIGNFILSPFRSTKSS